MMMNMGWQNILDAQEARFGDPESELTAARDATIIAPLTQFGLIGCVGDDAGTFLHNQLTSDVNHLEATSAQYAAWCSAKGRMLASLLLFRRDTEYLALLSADLREFIEKRLKIYVLRSKVSLIDRSADYGIIGISGPRAIDALGNAGLEAPTIVLGTSAFADASVVRLDETRYLTIVANDAVGRVWEKLSELAVPVGTPVWQWLDIRAGIPWIVDATQEAFVPQMAGFDRIGGVSFNKGCYPGQEVVARTRYLGKVKRHLYRTRTAVPLAAGLPVFPVAMPGQVCGQIANAAAAPDGGFDALAVILEDAVGQGELRATLADGGSVGLSDPVLVYG
ncbi:MAG: folate-binding protein [Candidatus Accumulibacter sp.]|jgi:folate-binding protein YgfZ|nr:folate-binding protein [Accumulibacter sp.]